MHDLKVWPDVEADPVNQSTTPGKSRDSGDQMSRLAKVRSLYIYFFFGKKIMCNKLTRFWSASIKH